MVVIHRRAKGQGQRSLGSKVGVEMDGRTDGRADRSDSSSDVLTQSVINTLLSK